MIAYCTHTCTPRAKECPADGAPASVDSQYPHGPMARGCRDTIDMIARRPYCPMGMHVDRGTSCTTVKQRSQETGVYHRDSENIDGTCRQQYHDGQRDHRLEHHEQLGPPGEHGHVRR